MTKKSFTLVIRFRKDVTGKENRAEGVINGAAGGTSCLKAGRYHEYTGPLVVLERYVELITNRDWDTVYRAAPRGVVEALFGSKREFERQLNSFCDKIESIAIGTVVHLHFDESVSDEARAAFLQRLRELIEERGGKLRELD